LTGAATTAGTVTTAAQPNITSVGTLSSLAVTGNTTSGNFVGTLNGSGANVTSISATNISAGTLAQARLANAAVTLGSTALTLGATVTTVAGLTSVTSTTFVGALTGAATTAATVTTAAQPNITSVGTLTSVSVTGNVQGGNLRTAGLVSATGTVTGSSFIGSGSALTGVVGWTTQANTPPASPRAGDFWYNSVTGIKYQYTATGTSNVWVDQSDPTVFQSITTGQIINANANGVGNIGTAAASFNTIFARATQAQYADLAEMYCADADYAPGTVLSFGGIQEVTISTQASDSRVAGVVSTHPAHLMNSNLDCDYAVALALTGRVPTLVTGQVHKGDMMVSAGNGHAQACATPAMGTVIGKALENFDGHTGTIEIVVGRM
jgi:hypothetical protein